MANVINQTFSQRYTLVLVAETHENQQLEVKQKVVDMVERKEVVELPVAAKSLVENKLFQSFSSTLCHILIV